VVRCLICATKPPAPCSRHKNHCPSLRANITIVLHRRKDNLTGLRFIKGVVGKAEQQFEHLTDAQIEHYGDRTSGEGPNQNGLEVDQAIETHLADCAGCRTRVLEFHRSRFGLMSDPFPSAALQSHRPTAECPSEDALCNLAAGLSSSSESATLTQHAAQCPHCGPILRAYTEDFSDDLTPEDQALLSQLKSSTPEWQKKMAQQMAAAVLVPATSARSLAPEQSASEKTRVAQPPTAVRTDQSTKSTASISRPSFFQPKWLFVPAGAIACALVAFFIWNAQRETPQKVEKLLAQAYPERRTVEMRWPGVAWGELRQTLGRAEGDKPSALLEADRLFQPHKDETRRKKEWLHIRAQKEILSGIPPQQLQQLIDDLKQASQSEPQSQSLMLDLAIADFRIGEITPDPHYYQDSKDVLDKMIASSRSSAALFNRAVVDQRLFDHAVGEQRLQLRNEAIADLEECLKREKDEAWRKEIEQKIANWNASPER
jgi:hypothetical protein